MLYLINYELILKHILIRGGVPFGRKFQILPSLSFYIYKYAFQAGC